MENGKQKAFPFLNSGGYGDLGLTKREYFAGLAMQGILSNPSLANLKLNPSEAMKDSVIIEYYIRMSDELLKQLDKPE
jgi:hypothetical protein